MVIILDSSDIQPELSLKFLIYNVWHSIKNNRIYGRQDYLTKSQEHKRMRRKPEVTSVTKTSGTDFNVTMLSVSDELKHKTDDFSRERKLLKKEWEF